MQVDLRLEEDVDSWSPVLRFVTLEGRLVEDTVLRRDTGAIRSLSVIWSNSRTILTWCVKGDIQILHSMLHICVLIH